MKKLIVTSCLSALFITALSQNPISPPGVYIADPSARVFNGKLYLYGSTDESCDYYCSKHHDVLSTKDMISWKLQENVFAAEGKNDEVPYNNNLLFAPDCVEKNEKYYLYYCQPDRENAEGAAIADTPVGPFRNGVPFNTGHYNEIDPAVFIDDDGSAYYLWGQFTLKMACLNENMMEIDPASIKDSILTESDHYFHEGAYMTKHNGIYYIVFADISREDKPTCIGYATSKKPMGPYVYRGVIIDNAGCNPGNWNNHGSIAEYNNQWYVFYHRSTHGCKMMRKACVEEITILEDGSIPEVEMTSQGAGGPLKANAKTDAARACLLHGNVRIQAENENNEVLGNLRNGDAAIFKYIDFGEGVENVRIRLKVLQSGRIVLSAGKPWNKRIASHQITTVNKDWKTIEFTIDETEGIHALWIQAYGDSEEDLFDIDWFEFF